MSTCCLPQSEGVSVLDVPVRSLDGPIGRNLPLLSLAYDVTTD